MRPPPATRREHFPVGRFQEGQQVKLRHPEDRAGSFANPAQALTIVGKFWFRLSEGPTYTLSESCGIPVTSFRDADLEPA